MLNYQRVTIFPVRLVMAFGILFLGKPIHLVNETWLAGKFQMKAK